MAPMSCRIAAAAALALVLSLSGASAPAADRINGGDALTRIRAEASERSQIMRSLHMLTDVYGPRLTGSPNAKAAAEWTIKTLTGWGLTSAHLEGWEFGHAGWVNERAVAQIVAPVRD